MADRLHVRCTENSVLAGTGGRRLCFSPSMNSEDTANGDFFQGTPSGEIDLVGVSEEVGAKYEVGQEYSLDLLLYRST